MKSRTTIKASSNAAALAGANLIAWILQMQGVEVPGMIVASISVLIAAACQISGDLVSDLIERKNGG